MGIVKGNTILITGGGTGFGKALALTLSEMGAQVIICGRRLDRLQQVADEAAAKGFVGSIHAIAADVSQEADVKSLVRQALDRAGRIDVLINNAATFEADRTADTSLQAWNTQLGINVTGPFLLMKELIPHFRANKGGRIINVTSAVAEGGTEGFAAYAASKAALESLTRTVAEEEYGNQIQVHLFNPGPIRTEMHATGKEPQTAVPALLQLLSTQNNSRSVQVITAP